MKKLIYLLLFISTTLTISSCTDEEVKPQADSTSSVTSSPIKE